MAIVVAEWRTVLAETTITVAVIRTERSRALGKLLRVMLAVVVGITGSSTSIGSVLVVIMMVMTVVMIMVMMLMLVWLGLLML